MAVAALQGTQTMLEKMDQVLAPAMEGVSDTPRAPRSKNASQPSDVAEGLEHAYKSLQDGLWRGMQKLDVPVSDMQEHGYLTRQLDSARLRAVPNAVLAPVIGSTEAVTKALLGVRNSFDPEAKAFSDRKYKAAATDSCEPSCIDPHESRTSDSGP